MTAKQNKGQYSTLSK